MSSVVDFRRIFMPAPVEYPPAQFHYDWSEYLLNGKKHYAVEGYRGCGKSTLVNRAFPLYILTFPAQKLNYVVFIMSTQTKASRTLKEIKDEYTSNPLLRQSLISIKEDNLNVFCAECRDIYGAKITVRLEAYGKGSSIRGALYQQTRPQIIIMDDCQDKDDAKSETTMEGDWDWFLSDIMFLGDKSRIFMIGNNLGESCLIERVFNHGDDLHFSTVRVPVYFSHTTANGEEVMAGNTKGVAARSADILCLIKVRAGEGSSVSAPETAG